MERLVVLPFTMGCVSQSSVSVGGAIQLKKPKSEPNPLVTSLYLSIYPSLSCHLSVSLSLLLCVCDWFFLFWFSKEEKREKKDHLGWDWRPLLGSPVGYRNWSELLSKVSLTCLVSPWWYWVNFYIISIFSME